MNVYTIDSTDAEAVNDLIMTLIRSEEMEFTVYNEYEEDITDEIKKLKSLKIRSIIKNRGIL